MKATKAAIGHTQAYDQHVRAYNFVQYHELQHMLHAYIAAEEQRVTQRFSDYSYHVGAWNTHLLLAWFSGVAGDYVVNDALTQQGN